MERRKEGFERSFLVFELVLREEKSLLGGVGGSWMGKIRELQFGSKDKRR